MLVESDFEELSLKLFSELEYEVVYGPNIAPTGTAPERKDYTEVVLVERLRKALVRINPTIPKEAIEDAIRKLLTTHNPNLIENNKVTHSFFVNGVDVEFKKDGIVRGDKVKVFDFSKPENNEFLAVNQFTVKGVNERRPDIVLFINGLPVAIIELKNMVDEKATIDGAFAQLQTYQSQIPAIFQYNEILITSDYLQARAGTTGSPKEWFMAWKSLDGKKIIGDKDPQLPTLIKGMLNKETFLDLIKNFIVFETSRKGTNKKIALYHQYYAVNKAVKTTLQAVSGNKKCGVVWHTQGSGKSLTMAFYAGKLVLSLDNPTLVVLTDRNDLDDQLFEKFVACKELLRQEPVQAHSISDLQKKLSVSSGGVIFTTIQKFSVEDGAKYPLLSDRKNIIIIADEAHRSQYGFSAKVGKEKTKYGFAKYLRDALPNASFIGFTGTPIEKVDRNTPKVFGTYIDTYTIERAVKDGATVKILYESRLAKIDLKPEERPKIDREFEEVTEGEEPSYREELKSKWARLEQVVGSRKRINRVAKDIVNHFESRLSAINGKGMIVGMSRRICVELYNEIIKLRPEWANDADDKGFLKVVMTGSATDPQDRQPHIRSKPKRKALAEIFKDPATEFKLAIVRDMWLTGFDVPCLHTMYLDKPMKGHTLMQAIARVNRVYGTKEGGLVVDYLGIAPELRKALREYSEDDRENFDTQEQAARIMLTKYENVLDLMHGFNYKQFFKAKKEERPAIILSAADHILKQDKGQDRFLKHVTELSKAFSLAIPDDRAVEIREDVALFQAIKAAIVKTTEKVGKSEEELETAIRQIVSNAIASDEVVDLFAAAGLKKPDISILSEEFVQEIKGMKFKNVAVELLKRLLNDEIKAFARRNLVKGKAFSEMLDETIRQYQNRSIETVEVIDELLGIAKQIKEAQKRGEDLKLGEDELAFYDALEVNDSAVKVLGDDILRKIAVELAEAIRKSTTVDWSLRESVRAELRLKVKKILRKYGYPPDKQAKATETVLEQAKIMSNEIVKDGATA